MHPDSTTLPYSADLALAIELAIAAADHHTNGDIGRILSKSSSTDPVTEVDQESERLVVEGLRHHRPDDAIVGEEGANHPGRSGRRWIIDPLDGTVNYLYGYPHHAVSIAMEDAGEFVLGVIHDSASNRVYSAQRGGGATVDGHPMRVRDQAHNIAECLLATGFAYDSSKRAIQAQVLTGILPLVRDIRRSGSCALDLCAVAEGRVDAMYEVGPNLWDIAAGIVIVTEAGGKTAWDPGRGRITASAPHLWDNLNKLLDTAEKIADSTTALTASHFDGRIESQ